LDFGEVEDVAYVDKGFWLAAFPRGLAHFLLDEGLRLILVDLG
jgi:hypothetical protein